MIILFAVVDVVDDDDFLQCSIVLILVLNTTGRKVEVDEKLI